MKKELWKEFFVAAISGASTHRSHPRHIAENARDIADACYARYLETFPEIETKELVLRDEGTYRSWTENGKYNEAFKGGKHDLDLAAETTT